MNLDMTAAPTPTLADKARATPLGRWMRLSDNVDDPRAGQVGRLTGHSAGIGTLAFADGEIRQFPASLIEHPGQCRETDNFGKGNHA